MTSNHAAFIAGAYEHPLRKAPYKTIAQLHAEVAAGALADAGLQFENVDGFFTAGDSPGLGPLSMAEYMGIRPRHFDATDSGGSSYIVAVNHAAHAIAAGSCDVALVTLAGKPRSGIRTVGDTSIVSDNEAPDVPYEAPFALGIVDAYAMSAKRHAYEFGTTAEQLAWVKVAASVHAQHNENALLRNVVTVDEVLESPMISDPLHRLDCCVITDGGGALVIVRPEVARALKRPLVGIRGGGEAVRGVGGGHIDLVSSAGRESGREAFRQAGVTARDIKYASLYDSFTITVIVQLEDLGFCPPGEGGRFVQDGGLIARHGRLAVNTDGGGLCNNHPGNRGGMTKVVEAVRQLRGEAHPAVQVENADLALAHGTGGFLATRHGSATVILERV